MTPLVAATVGLMTIVGVLSLVWIASLPRRDVSIVDICWGPGFAVLAWTYCALFGAFEPRALLVAALVTIWGARLAWHINRRHRGAGEDPRYAAIRARHGAAFWWRSLLTVFWLQATLIWIIGLPLLAVAGASAPPSLGAWDVAGLGLFTIGFAFEAIGDHQLRRFKAAPANRGKVLETGLWRYTRHPNYFGDALLWWGLYLIAASIPAGRLMIASPALMTFLLLRVSGVSLLERGLRRSKSEYAGYIARTSAFFPWFPARGER
jgi:steroid 5-alpha reductase family enzyme